MEGLRGFIKGLLEEARVNEKHINEILSPENMKEMEMAFTHSSFDSVNNYELYEYLGDGSVNEFVPYYIRERFPNIISVKWLTRIKHNLVSKKQLAKLARNRGIEKYIRMSQEIQELKKKKQFEKNKDYMSILEDVMEAFIGCLIIIIQKSGRSHGVAVQIVHNLLRSFFDQEEIDIEYSKVFDPISRLKELYESKVRNIKWPYGLDKSYVITRANNTVKVEVYGWPLHDKKAVDANKMLLATTTDTNQEEALTAACEKALEVLDSSYGIKEFIPNAHQK